MCPQIRNILKQGIETPEDQNDLRKMQLRELARLNGTLREDDNRSVTLPGLCAQSLLICYNTWSLKYRMSKNRNQGWICSISEVSGHHAYCLLYPQDSSSLAEL